MGPALRKSGTNCFFIETFKVFPWPITSVKAARSATLPDVLKMSNALGMASLGVIPTAQGLAIRCEPKDVLEVTALVRPDEAMFYGNVLTDKTKEFLIKGVDKRMTYPGLHRALLRHCNWRIMPRRSIDSKAAGKTDDVVWAVDDPPASIYNIATRLLYQLRSHFGSSL